MSRGIILYQTVKGEDMNTLVLITALALLPGDEIADIDKPIKRKDTVLIREFRRIDLNIAVNPETVEGKVIKQHLTRDWIAFLLPRLKGKDWATQTNLLKVLGKAEYDRRELIRHFNIKFHDTSDESFFYVGYGGLKTYFPEFEVGLQEFPGYISFFSWVKDAWFYDYYHEKFQAIEGNIRNDWNFRRKLERRVFAKDQVKLGYSYHDYGYYDEHNYDWCPEGFMKQEKGREYETFFSFEELGFETKIETPWYPKPPVKRKCPFDEQWELPGGRKILENDE